MIENYQNELEFRTFFINIIITIVVLLIGVVQIRRFSLGTNQFTKLFGHNTSKSFSTVGILYAFFDMFGWFALYRISK